MTEHYSFQGGLVSLCCKVKYYPLMLDPVSGSGVFWKGQDVESVQVIWSATVLWHSLLKLFHCEYTFKIRIKNERDFLPSIPYGYDLPLSWERSRYLLQPSKYEPGRTTIPGCDLHRFVSVLTGHILCKMLALVSSFIPNAYFFYVPDQFCSIFVFAFHV